MRLFCLICSICFLLSCKSTQVESNSKIIYKVKLEDYIKMYTNKGLITSNPLIILNSKPYKLFSELNSEDDHVLERKVKDYSYINKNSKYFKEKIGVDAENGIILIKTKMIIYCGGDNKWDFLVNDELVDSEGFYLEKMNKKIKYSNSIYRLQLKNAEILSVAILETE